MRIYELRIGLLILTCQFSYFLCAQNNFPKNYFRSPIDTDIFLSATFGEPRMNHFHSGIDIKTNNTEGWKVYAAADGYVSRIKISAFGYGKAIYITHPNGYVTVYGHLQKFNSTINNWVKQKQYEKESFEIELYPDAKDFSVKKGEVIAFSGNSGSSAAPHLHFEIRDGKTEEPINPLLFGINVKDNSPPTISGLLIYDLENPGNSPLKVKVTYKDKKYVAQTETVFVSSNKIGIGVSSFDPSEFSQNKNGIYNLGLKVDNQTCFSFEMKQFSFDETRIANCCIDYSEKKTNAADVYKCILSEANDLKIYDSVSNRGIINLEDKKTHAISLIAKDFSGNFSKLDFKIKKEGVAVKQISNLLCNNKMYSQQENNFQKEEINLHFPQRCFYDSLCFSYSKRDTNAENIFSATHQVHNWFVPVNKSYSISIKTKNLPLNLKEKGIVVFRDENGNLGSKGGSFENGFVTTKVKELGEFFVMTDTTAPKISTINISDGKEMSKEESIRVKITDNLSGINFYRAEADGKWILMEYDAKNNLLTHTFDEKIMKGKHELKLVVRDERKNEKILKMKFTR